jgi:hypothetical protein
MDNHAFETREATRWLWSDRPILAFYATRVLARLCTAEAHAAIDHRLYLGAYDKALFSICAASTCLGARYQPGELATLRLFACWVLEPDSNVVRVLERGYHYLNPEHLHALLGSDLDEDALHLLNAQDDRRAGM